VNRDVNKLGSPQVKRKKKRREEEEEKKFFLLFFFLFFFFFFLNFLPAAKHKRMSISEGFALKNKPFADDIDFLFDVRGKEAVLCSLVLFLFLLGFFVISAGGRGRQCDGSVVLEGQV
jgi:hypothetical protein